LFQNTLGYLLCGHFYSAGVVIIYSAGVVIFYSADVVIIYSADVVIFTLMELYFYSDGVVIFLQRWRCNIFTALAL
jgi:hypothetical protein